MLADSQKSRKLNEERAGLEPLMSALDQWKDGRWVEFANGTSIGNRRLVRGEFLTTDKVRMRITQASVCPALSEVGLFCEPAAFRAQVERNKKPFKK